MTLAQLRMILGALVALSATVMSCAKRHAADEATPAFTRHLGESTASPGANASKPAPVPPDAPERMNVSMGIRNLPNPEVAPPRATAPAATSPNATVNTNTSPAAPNANPTPAPDQATSSTEVPPPADITPPSTTPAEPEQPGVFSPPPPSDSAPPPQPAPEPTPAPAQ